jgi:hypothetical protein
LTDLEQHIVATGRGNEGKVMKANTDLLFYSVRKVDNKRGGEGEPFE